MSEETGISKRNNGVAEREMIGPKSREEGIKEEVRGLKRNKRKKVKGITKLANATITQKM